ncbi:MULTISPECIES: methionine ABC transporter ATP-binding protein [unclassified Paenibacillus]|uniref:methionine ABC transporter ATP-binding protein n=1 Tax=unclassified Paenibacillus TaxID=185978 RepID=UPI001AE3243A|nr:MULTISPECIES: methionine ABC transporter ATP-binding protein [unclassified Paenibacillus]MBP1153353.1 D-methionine transport system ATP-binding protein [Paenibacillus sp. PvP091]MBP1171264.1 D-methionine transport system ATP-binding protein [Paenibacillus sp. PvR098]MBP2442292.1 D-methionine transport system ATP-binding protein [Paenibacillus sp. PvP052]
MIQLIDLHKEYKTKKGTVLGVDRVNLTVRKGDIFGIVGYSGAGKSSVLRCINLLEKPTSGKVMVDGLDLTSLSKEELRIARQKIGMIFQHFYLISSKTVFENVAFALKAAGKSPSIISKRVTELLQLVGLADKADHYPAQLSGGQKQRVGIARALANDPQVLLCDEPTSALDPTTTQSILSLLRDINKTLGLTIVLITHEMEVVKDLCHHVAIMQDGRIIEEGLVYDIFANPIQPLTREFISNTLEFKLPQKLWDKLDPAGKVVKVLFRDEAAEQAIIYDMLKASGIKANILHGKIEYIGEKPLGTFIMEVTGGRLEIDNALQYLVDRSCGVEVVTRVE